jgi:hypothetical protein
MRLAGRSPRLALLLALGLAKQAALAALSAARLSQRGAPGGGDRFSKGN